MSANESMNRDPGSALSHSARGTRPEKNAPMRIGSLVLGVLLALPLAAQSVREVTTVEVVEVPVYVTDGGKPVTGLTREHFRLFVNGKPQSIDYFDAVDFAGLSADEAQNPKQRRLYFLLFDLTSQPFAMVRARRAVDEFVQQAGPADAFAVGTIGQRGLSVVVPFTRDRDAIRHAVRALNAETRDPLRLAAYSPSQQVMERSRWDTDADPILDSQLTDMMKGLGEQPVIRAVHDTVGLLDGLARQLAPLEGHKHVVLLSSGFDTTVILRNPLAKPLADVTQAPMVDMTSAITEKMVLTKAGAPDVSPGLFKALEQMNARYAGASVFLDAIDIAGLRATWGAGDSDALRLLARTGQVVANRNNLGEAIRYLSDTQRMVYVLGFHARDPRKQNGVRVELVNVPGSPTVTHRRSFSSTAPESASSLLLADIVANDIPQNGLTVAATVDATKPRSATLSIAIPGRELLALGGDHVSAQALLYIFSGTRAVAFQGKEIEIDPKRAAHLEELQFGVRQTFDLEPGTYTAKVLVRVIGAEARGFARTEFTVRD